jgi:amino acid adenylation domain-containing protein
MRPEQIEDIYPLTPLQEGILFHSLLEPEAGPYFRQWICALRGRLDAAALRRAWQEVVDRHTVLRTAFVWEEVEAPLQVVCRRVELPFRQEDWRGVDAAEQACRFACLLERDRRAAIDLSAAPLLRVTLVQVADDLHRMVWSFHHILLDGLSVALVVRRVIACYLAFRRGERPAPQRARPFRDYIAWLQGRDVAAAEAYWRRALGGFRAPTPLPADLPETRPADGGAAGSPRQQRDCVRLLSPEVTEALRDFGRRNQVTLNTLLQGAWALLVGRHSGTDDVVFGATVAGRPAELPDGESIVGLFINTLPVRACLPPERPWAKWLRALQGEQAEARQYDFSPLVRVQQWSEVPAGEPLFGTLVVFENYRVEEAAPERAAELEIEEVRFFDGTNYPLTLIVRPGRQLGLRAIYDAERCEAAAVARLLGHLQSLIEGGLAAPLSRLDELPLLSGAERHQLCREWSDTGAACGVDLVHRQFERQAARTPAAVALVAADGALTYAELDRRSNRLARHLRGLGVGPETLVGFAVERTSTLVVGLLGILKSGGAYLPLDPAYPAERLRYMLEHSRAPLLLTQESLQTTLPFEGLHCVLLDREEPRIAALPDSPLEPATLDSSSLAYVLYTSGSTGRPKGVQIGHAALANFLASMAKRPGLASGARLVAVTSLSFDIAGLELFLPLLCGATIDLVSRDAAADGTWLAERLRGAAAMQATPATWRLLLDSGWEGSGELAALCGGEALPPRLAAELLPRVGSLWNLYGPTETTIWSSVARITAGGPAGAATIPIGRPIAETAIYVLDRALEPVPIGVVGDLYLGGAGLARAYLGRPDLTAEAFLPAPFGGRPGVRMYRTGDLARVLPDGRLDCLGRRDQQVKVRGFRIELGEIEAALARHPAVDAAAATVWREAEERAIAAYWVGKPGASPLAGGELLEHLRALLPDYMLPAAIIRLEELPLTANRKIDRRALPEPASTAVAGDGLEVLDGSRSPVEEVLAGIWGRVLKRERIGAQDSFFALGGHSLLATQVVSRIDQALGVRLPLRTLFDRPTLAGLARAVEEARRDRSGESEARPPLVAIGRDRPLRLSFAQQRLWFLAQLEPGSSAYNLPKAYRLSGALDDAALAASIGELVGRHEVLRTTFPVRGGVPVQVVHPAAPAGTHPLPRVDLSGLGPAIAEEEAHRLADEEARRPFDLAVGPVLRAFLLRLADEDHLALLTLHHVASDGWSSGILLRDLARLYRSQVEGVAVALPDLPVQYADYAEWQRGWLEDERTGSASTEWRRGRSRTEPDLSEPEGRVVGLRPQSDPAPQKTSQSVLAAELDYWRRQLDGLPRLLELPSDRPRPAVLGDSGGRVEFRLPAALALRLRDFTLAEGSTLFMTLGAGFAALLSRISGQERLAVGTPVAGRTRVETEDLIGLFVNTLVLRCDLAAAPSFRQLAARLREVVLEAHAHQDLPFDRLVEELQPARSLSHAPLFQVAFVLQNAPREVVAMPGLSLRPYGASRQTSKFDLTLVLHEEGEEIAGSLEHNLALFDRQTIVRLAGHLQALLEGALAEPAREVAALPLLRGPERHQVEIEWNDRRAAYPNDRCIHEIFAAVAERFSAKIAVRCEGEKLTYAELDERSDRLARRLQRLGVGPEVPVAIFAERSIGVIAGLLATLKAGGYFVPLDPSMPAGRLAELLAATAAPVVLTQGSLAARLPQGEVVVVDLNAPESWVGEEGLGPAAGRSSAGADRALARHSPPREAAVAYLEETQEETKSWVGRSLPQPVRGAGSRNLAYVMHTSGSTGRPKAVAVEHRAVVRLLRGNDFAHFGAEEVFLQLAPLAFDASTLEIWGPLLNGGRLVLMPSGTGAFGELGRVLREERVTTLWLTAGLFHQTVDERLEELSGLRQLLAGGDVLSPARVRRVRRELPELRLIDGYGPTEGTTFTTCHTVGEADDLDDPAYSVPVGRPIRNSWVRILSPGLAPQPIGVPGELYAGGDGLARGYLGQPDLTAERFVPDPLGSPGARLYRTGDLARLRRDGVLEFLGRADDQVKIRGFRVEPGEVESVVRLHPSVLDAAVVVRSDPRGERALAAYVVPRDSGSYSFERLQGFAAERLPAYMLPVAWVRLDALPLNANGKVDRGALARLDLPEAEGARVRAEGEPFATPVEELLAGIWSEVLRVEGVGRDDDFFARGGHSLLATQVASRVRSLFAIEMPVRAIFEMPVLADLAAAVERERAAGGRTAAGPIVPVERTGRLPLSFAQRRLWFLDRLEPGGSAYNVPLALHVRGPLDAGLLAAVLSELVRRHEVLRTTFAAAGGEPEQRIQPAAAVPLPVCDLSALPADRRFAAAVELARQEARYSFDLERGPLLRARLLRLGVGEHLVSLTLHHVVCDGWSMGVLTRQFAALYGALAAGRPPSLPEPAVQYADFAAWQREALSEEVLAAEVAAWRERLAALPPLLELPLDRPRPALQTFRGRRLSLPLPPETAERVASLARRTGATPFMVLLAVFWAQLGRLSGQRQVAVGSPVAGRTRAEIEDLIGFFANTLVLAGDLTGDPTLSTLLARARETTLFAYEHQELPFERLVEELAPERSLAHSPLFQVMLSLRNAPGETLELPGLSLAPLAVAPESAKFDWSLGFGHEAGRLAGSLEVNADLFDPATAGRLGAQYSRLLAAAVADLGLRVSELPLLSEPERQALLHDWQGGGEAGPRVPLHRLVEGSAARTPEAPALVPAEGRALTYGELDCAASGLARELRRCGVGPEVVVGVLAERTPRTVVAMLAVWKAGGAYLPLDPAYPAPRLAFMLEDSGAPVVLAPAALLASAAALATGGRRILGIDDLPYSPGSEPSPALPEVELESTAYLIYTSGSSGQPKGVAVAHGAACEHFLAVVEVWGLGALDRVHLFTSPSFDASLDDMVPALSAGATVTFDPELWEPRQLLARCAALGVTVLDLPTAYWSRWMAELEGAPVPLPPGLRLRHLVVAGEAMPIEPALAWLRSPISGVRLWNAYGPTEGIVTAAWYEVGVEGLRPGTVPIGHSGRRRSAYVLGGAAGIGELVPLGVSGELCLGGPLLARGYLGRPDWTAERFVPDPFSSKPGGRLYRTGDLARRRGDGRLEFLGRVDQQVKIRGFRIELGEIEAVLLQHPGLREAAVVARADDPGPLRLVAYVVAAEPGASPRGGRQELRSHLKARLPEYMIPAEWIFLEALPLGPSGKVDRNRLPRPEAAAPPAGEEPAFRTLTEELTAGIWSELLRRPGVSPADDFFFLGGHSLLATQLVSRLRDTFGVEVPVRAVFETPLLADLAARVDRERQAASGADRRPFALVPRPGRLPLSAAQRRLWFLEQLEPGAAYNLPLALRVSGPLDVPALGAALDELVRRHEVLRTIFPAPGGEPEQRIHPPAGLPLPLLDLSALSAGAALEEAGREARREAREPFDLARGPVVRGRLLRLGADDHVVILTLHHLVGDGWSMAVLLREVGLLYGAAQAGRRSPLPELPLQYADYALWQRSWLTPEVEEREIAFWRQLLAGAPALLDLPLDRPRPAVWSGAGDSVPLHLPPSLGDDLRVLCRSHGATLFMALLAALDVLLGRYSDQQDLTVGVPVAGRTRTELEPLIGFFVNTVALRADLSGDPAFAELLARVRRQALAAHDHQELPFDRVVEALAPERSQSHGRLFQVMFAVQAAGLASPPRVEELELAPFAAPTETAKVDLTITLSETAEGLRGAIQFATALFDRATIARLAACLANLVASAAGEPRRRLSELELLGPGERREILARHAGPAVDLASFGAQTIHERFSARARAAPERVALRFGDFELSYGELEQRSDRLARYLRRHGVGVETAVPILAERSVEMVLGMLAVLKAGGVYLPLDPRAPEERLRFQVEEAGGRLALVQERLRGHLGTAVAREVPLEGGAWEAERGWNLRADATPDSLAYVMYTSGSTGTPKGVAVPHRAVLRLVLGTDYVALGEDDRIAHLSNVAFDASTFEIWGALLTGGRVVGIGREVALSPRRLVETLRAERVTTLFLTTALFNQVVNEVPDAFRTLREVLFGGEAVDPRPPRLCLESGPPARLLHVYGPTENTTFSTWYRIAAVAPVAATIPIGGPIGGSCALVLDRAMSLQPWGIPGELYVGGEGLARGYLSRPDLTAERFVPDPMSGAPGERLYRTGDLVRLRPEGGIEFLGRADQQVKIRGFRIELGEIEGALQRHPEVRECAVAALREADGPARLVGYVVPRGTGLEAAELQAYLRQRLPEYMVPAAWVWLDALPLNPNGKVDRRALPAPEPAQAMKSEGGDGFHGPVEELLAGIWSELLRTEGVGRQADFFALGGHSLLATQVTSRVRALFGVELPVRAVFESPVLADLAAVIEREIVAADGREPVPPISAEGRPKRLPLSFAQQRLWFLDQLDPGGSSYNVPVALRIAGPLETRLLAAVLSEVVRRHEVLRTTLPAVAGEPVQEIHAAAAVELPLIDLGGLPPDRRESEAQAWVREETGRGFDLGRGPLLRARLLRLGPADHGVVLTLHHVVCDGWSMGLLTREVSLLYAALAAGGPSPLPALPIQYADFALWQRRRLSGEGLEQELAFWRRLAGAPAVVELPLDRPRTAAPRRRGGSVPLVLAPELARDLAALSRRQGATLFMTLLAGLQALLGRYSGQDEVTVGTPVAGRTRVEVESLIGFFVNTLALRVELEPTAGFADLLRRVRERVLEAHAHQEIPFERLVEELAPERSLDHTPLFQVVLAFQNAPRQALELPGLTARPIGGDPPAPKFDLTIGLGERAGGGIEGLVEYDAALFDRGTAERLAGHLRAILGAAVQTPELEIARLPLLAEPERHQLLVEWNDRRSDYPGACVHEIFESVAKRWGRRVAVACDGESLRYAELNARANRLAHRLRRLGVGPEVPVAVFADRSIGLIVGLLATLKAGGYFVPLDPRSPAERLALLLAESGAPVLLTERRLAAGLPPSRASCLLLDDPAAWQEESVSNLPPLTGSRNLAYVMYTSGSTGRPKGVAVEHRSVVRLVRGNDFAELSGETFLQMAPLAFDASTLEIWGPLLNGGRLVVMPPGALDLEALGELLRREKVSTAWLTAGLFHQMVDENLAGLSGLRQLLAGGDVLSPAHVRRLRRELPRLRLINGYGPTEGTTFTCCATISGDRAFDGSVPIGRPIRNTQVYVLSPDFAVQPAGVPGELFAGGDGLARGYLGRPDLTAERFVPDPFGAAGDRLYRTGDRARLLAGGALEFLGRIDTQVKIRGFRVEPEEVESILREHGSVLAAAVVARRDEAGAASLAAYVVPRPEQVVAIDAIDELRSWLVRRVPDYMVPASWTRLDALPLNANGKVDRRALPEPEREAGRARDSAPQAGSYRSITEELLAGIWSEVLRVESVGRDDDFFALGGHSLLATQLVSRMRAAFGVELAVRSVFEAPKLADLALELERARPEAEEDAGPELVAVPRTGPLPLSFAQRRLWFLEQLEPGGSSYNVPLALRIAGPLRVEVLEAVLCEVVRRHEALRTTFVEVGGEPRQRIDGGPAAPPLFQVRGEGAPRQDSEELPVAPLPDRVLPGGLLPLPFIDLTALPLSAREGEAQWVARLEAGRPFDLARGPLLRARVLKLGAEDHVVSLTLHHIVSDGWSMGVLAREVGVLYEAAAAGRASPLPELGIQYADYAAWQHARLTGERLERELAFWRGRLAGLEPALDLPLDRPRPAERSVRGGAVPLRLGAELSRGVTALSRRSGATPFMTLLASFAGVLSRVSGAEDLSVGTPVAGRTRVETEGLIGFFVNTLVLRAELAGDPSFASVLEQTRERSLEAHAHQEVPFERLVEELAPERSLSHSPLFQVMLVLQNTARQRLELAGLTMSSFLHGDPGAKYDLLLGLQERVGEISGELGYAADVFDRTTVQRLERHWEEALRAVVADPGMPLSAWPLLAEAESHQILREWNATGPVEDSELLHALFERRAAEVPERTALISGEESLTYGELNRRADLFAAQLRRAGVGPEVPVAVRTERSPEMVIALLAVLKAGGFYLPLDPKAPEERLRFLLADTGAHVLVTQRALAEALPLPARELILLDIAEAAQGATNQGESSAATLPGNLAYLIYTSGSTGRPKAVAIEHRSAALLLRWARTIFSSDELSGVLAATAYTFDLSIFEIFVPLSWGGTVILAENALALPNLPARSAVTLVNTVPSAYAELLHRDAVPSSVVTVNLAGEALPRPLADRIYAAAPSVSRLYNLYGPSEDTTYSTWARVERGGERTPPIGRPISGTRAYVVDLSGDLVPMGVSGELLLGGHGLARGYLGRPELTAERFVPDRHGGEPGARLYRTGDRVRSLPDGSLEFLGRLDHQVKIRGFRIEPGEIEAALATHAGVRETVVVPRVESRGGLRLVAYVASGARASPSVEELRAFLRRTLPDFMIPTAWVRLAELPRNAHGKVDRRALPEPEAPQTAGAGPKSEAFRTLAEELLAGIWSEVLRIETVGRDDDFFALGGHSLLATQLVSRVRAAFGIELTVRSVFEAPKLAELAAVVERAGAEGAEAAGPPLVPAPRTGPLPLSFAQQRLWFLDRLEPGTSAYNMPLALRVAGKLRVEVLKAVLGEVVRRHEALRTTFSEVDGEPRQRISDGPMSPPLFRVRGEEAPRQVEVEPAVAPPPNLFLPVIDLCELPHPVREREAQRLARLEAGRPFDLARGPLLRAQVLRLDAGDHVVSLTLHHIVSDGWSMGVLTREVTALYEALAAGRPSPLPELAIQYADYAAWQRERLSGERLEREIAFWRGRLGGAPAAVELPFDRPRPAERGTRGGSIAVRLGPELSRGLTALSRRSGATPFMTLLASFCGVLARVSDTDDLTVGTPVAGRTRVVTEGLIGFFVNTLVLRAELAGDPSFTDALGQLRERSLEAHAHQEVPFERLVEELAPERSLSHSPLFQVMLVLQNTRRERLDLQGLSLQPFLQGDAGAKYDLLLGLEESAGEIAGDLSFAADVFDRTTVQRLERQWESALRAIVASPETPLAAWPLLAEAESHQIRHEWNATAALEEPELLHTLFEQRAAEAPERTALISGEERLSYGELNLRADHLAAQLLYAGVGPEIPVAVRTERTPEMVIALLAVLKAGGFYLPLDPKAPEERLRFLLADARAQILLTQRPLAEALPLPIEAVLLLDENLGGTGSVSSQWRRGRSRTEPENLAYLIYTSGSTGRPKAVAIEHRSAALLVRWARALFSDAELSGVLAATAYTFDLSIFEIFVPLSFGGTVILAENALQLPDLPARSAVTLVNTVPSAFAELLQRDAVPPSVVTVNLAGEALPRALADRVLAASSVSRLYNLYGPSEDTTYSTWARIEPRADRTPPIGRPISGTRAYVVDSSGDLLPIGVAGELLLGGRGLARGYLGRPELTAERFVPDRHGLEPGARLYRTGDRVRSLPDGSLEFLGRLDHQVKIRGFRIEPGEIESVLLGHPGVREVLVAPRDDGHGELQLVAYVALAGEIAPTVEELRAFLRKRLPDYLIPTGWVPLAELPRNAHGKVDRRALAEHALARAPTHGSPPRDRWELELAGLWQEVLGVAAVNAGDDFFALGGHSLLAVRLAARIERSFAVALPVASLFRASTLEGMASLLRAGGEPPASARSLVPLAGPRNGVSEPPLFLMHAGAGHVLCYLELARLLDGERPLYGLQTPAWREGDPPREIESLAETYMEEILAVQPEGAYHLAGWSLGGLLAFEVARRLERRGHRVGLLALIDSRPQQLSPGAAIAGRAAGLDELDLLAAFARDLGLSAAQLEAAAPRARAAAGLAARLALLLEVAREAGALPPDLEVAQIGRLFAEFRRNVEAMARYAPRPFGGSTHLLVAGDSPDSPFAAARAWHGLAGELTIDSVPGDHHTMIRQPHVQRLAAALRSALKSCKTD